MKPSSRSPFHTRQKIVLATIQLILRQGYSSTSIDQICKEAGVTKGALFHHFANKEAIALTAIQQWGEIGASIYNNAWKNEDADPLERVGIFINLMIQLSHREEVCTCVVGIMSQEIAQSSDALREACAKELKVWTDHTAQLLKQAKNRYCPEAAFDPEAVAWFLNSVWQGSMLVAKTCLIPGTIQSNLEHFRQWVSSYFPAEARPLLSPSIPNPTKSNAT